MLNKILLALGVLMVSPLAALADETKPSVEEQTPATEEEGQSN